MAISKLELNIINQIISYGVFVTDNEKENETVIRLAKALTGTFLIKGSYLYALFSYDGYMKDIQRDEEYSLSKQWELVDVTML